MPHTNPNTLNNENQVASESSCKACTWLPESNCGQKGCNLRSLLACRWNPKEYDLLMTVQMPSALISIFALIMIGVIVGMWWPLVAWIAWALVIWPLGLEPLVLCRHCPYYSDEGKTITCWALRYMPKWWKYNPRPMNELEKFVMRYLLFYLSESWPIAWAGFGILYAAWNYHSLGIGTLLGMLGIFLSATLTWWAFNKVIWMNNCYRCVAFSCPFNTVPEEQVDAYLKMNPEMMEAWIKHGYKLGGTG
jgi:hypothetical protein